MRILQILRNMNNENVVKYKWNMNNANITNMTEIWNWECYKCAWNMNIANIINMTEI